MTGGADARDPATSQDVSAQQLLALYADLGRRIDARASADDALAAVTAVALETVPGAMHASITRSHADRYQTMAPTDPTASAADRLQYELNSGPCIDSVRADVPLIVADLAADGRWPVFGPLAALRFGIGSMLSIRMVFDDDIDACLNLYSDDVGAFTARSQLLGTLLTAHGAVAVSHVIARERAVNLERALVNSRRIGMAVGVLMSARKLTADQAFDLMRIVSQNSNQRMPLIAEEVIETGTLDVPEHAGGS